MLNVGFWKYMAVVLNVVQNDVLEMEAVDLLDVRKLLISHESIEGGTGFFLDRVVIFDPAVEGFKVTTFECNRFDMILVGRWKYSIFFQKCRNHIGQNNRCFHWRITIKPQHVLLLVLISSCSIHNH